MNYMKQVAQMLGVEFGEVFKVSGIKREFRLKKDDGLQWYDNYWVNCEKKLTDILCGKHRVIKMDTLDNIEKKYLSNIIKPFRDKVLYITKYRNGTSECVSIKYKDKADDEYVHYISLPYFHRGTMYRGMIDGKDYTLEELGL